MSTTLIRLCLELLVVWSCITHGSSDMRSDSCAEPNTCDSIRVAAHEQALAREPVEGVALRLTP